MSEIEDQLQELIKITGIVTAVVVGSDGFAIAGVSRDGTTDTEEVAAVMSSGLASAKHLGGDLNVGSLKQGMLEYEDGVLVMASLGEHALLGVLCDQTASLGMVRFEIKRRAKELMASM